MGGMNPLPDLLGERVRQAREARGLSQKQLADLAGIGKTAMFDLEHGNPGVRLNTLLAVLDFLGIPLTLGEEAALPRTPPAVQEDGDDFSGSLPDHLL